MTKENILRGRKYGKELVETKKVPTFTEKSNEQHRE